MSVRPIFAWYVLWVGAFWDGGKRRLYVFPVPCFGIVIQFGPSKAFLAEQRANDEAATERQWSNRRLGE